jgi:hypothetical protein
MTRDENEDDDAANGSPVGNIIRIDEDPRFVQGRTRKLDGSADGYDVLGRRLSKLY